MKLLQFGSFKKKMYNRQLKRTFKSDSGGKVRDAVTALWLWSCLVQVTHSFLAMYRFCI